MAKGKNRNKIQLIQDMKNEAANKIVSENVELAEEIKVWLQDKKAKLEELEQLKLTVDEYGEAKTIIEEKEKIIKDAQDEKIKLESEIAELTEKKDEFSEEIKRVEEIIGDYSEAETIVDAAKNKAEEIVGEAEKISKEKISEAKKEAETIKKEATEAERKAQEEVAEAGKQAQEIIKQAEIESEEKKTKARKIYDDAVSEKDILLTQATESANTIRNEAEAKVKELISGFEAEGKSKKASIISEAELDAEKIKASAVSDAELLAESIKKQADDYAQKTREQAEKESENIRNRANQQSETIYAKAEKVREQADAYYEEKIEKANEDIQKLRNKLETELDKCARQMQDNEDAARRNKDKEAALEQREENLIEEVNSLVDEKCEEKNAEIQRAREQALKYRDLYRSLESVRQFLKDEKNKDFPKKAEELTKLRKQVKTLEAFGITADNAGSYKDAKNNEDALKEEIYELTTKLEQQQDLARKHIDRDAELSDAYDRIKRYEEQISQLKDQLDSQKTVSREEMIAPILMSPSDWSNNSSLPDDRYFRSDDGEKMWLENIVKKADDCGIVFSKRLVNAFHTAQKINDMSSLVVLAGVSGTGKSELPKQYAIHGGMNFIDIPVKPDWDSPSALFGYYNSIERRFEATELIRALYQMDSENSPNSPFKDQMLMVLLDEMNLAHPEQYFADLLSKLETCRNMGKDAVYDTILGGGAKPLPIHIGSNVLWTGTMNEDETTKALSDKVVDRSTLITFPRPEILFDRKDKKDIKIVKQEFVLNKNTWDYWCGNKRDGIDEKLAPYKEEVQGINKHMSRMGRNLGHRVWQGMSEYICNYPSVVSAKNETDLDEAIRVAYNDALAFKIMPKLRGVETRGDNELHLNEIAKILTEHTDEYFQQDFESARTLPTELFQWYTSRFLRDKED